MGRPKIWNTLPRVEKIRRKTEKFLCPVCFECFKSDVAYKEHYGSRHPRGVHSLRKRSF